MRGILRKIRRMAAFSLAVVLTASLMPAEYLSRLFTESFPGNVEAEVTLSNPRIVEDSSMESGQKVTWDCIWFGSYPQTEIVLEGSLQEIALKEMNTYFNIEYISLPKSQFDQLQNADYNEQGDTVINGTKFRRIKGEDLPIHSGYSGAN